MKLLQLTLVLFGVSLLTVAHAQWEDYYSSEQGGEIGIPQFAIQCEDLYGESAGLLAEDLAAYLNVYNDGSVKAAFQADDGFHIIACHRPNEGNVAGARR